eukprot:TRINITY_DN72714_c0_g1_i1.p1 TRINITY_DN72714_c0_g1~~TRINITY_DN72714_c0_g1_i1.p1  ORF type:complete len:501 (+),score=0.80 TRINITY_DN72714_c0_g1_i1:204-1706(+)
MFIPEYIECPMNQLSYVQVPDNTIILNKLVPVPSASSLHRSCFRLPTSGTCIYLLINLIVFSIAQTKIPVLKSKKLLAEICLSASHCVHHPFSDPRLLWTLNINGVECEIQPLVEFGLYRTRETLDPISGIPLTSYTDVAVLGIFVQTMEELQRIHEFVVPLKLADPANIPSGRVRAVGFPSDSGSRSLYDCSWMYSPALNISAELKKECIQSLTGYGGKLVFSEGDIIRCSKDVIASMVSTIGGMSGGPVLGGPAFDQVVGVNYGAQSVKGHFDYAVVGAISAKLLDPRIPPEIYYTLNQKIAEYGKKGKDWVSVQDKAYKKYRAALEKYYKRAVEPLCYNLATAVAKAEVQRIVCHMHELLQDSEIVFDVKAISVGKYLFGKILQRCITICFSKSVRLFSSLIHKKVKADDDYSISWNENSKIWTKRFVYGPVEKKWYAGIPMKLTDNEIHILVVYKNGKEVWKTKIDAEFIGIWKGVVPGQNGDWVYDITDLLQKCY